jgi:ribose transport system ATP-binding protein
MSDASLDELIHQMVGRQMKDIYPRIPHRIGKPVLELRQLAGPKKPLFVNLALREGEVLGIAGLIGAGRTETLRACFGLDRVKEGTVLVHGSDLTRQSPCCLLSRGVGLLSENRKEEGLLLNRSLADNLTLTRYKPLSRFGFISERLQRETTTHWIQRLGVRAQEPSQKIGELSGGNQQKLAIGRLLHQDATILLLDEPTRGIDVGSKAQVYRLIGELAAEGKAIIFVSSYLPELLGVCDTIGVMCRGVLSEVRPAAEWTEHTIIAAAINQKEPEQRTAFHE